MKSVQAKLLLHSVSYTKLEDLIRREECRGLSFEGLPFWLLDSILRFAFLSC